MKKKSMIALAATALLLTGCNGKSAKEPEKAEEGVTTTQQQPKKGKEKSMGVTQMTAEMFKAKVMNYDKNKTEWVFEGDKPVVIDFYATWCGPCKVTAPIVEELSKDYAGKIDFYKVDVDQQQELAAVFGIRSIPTFLFVPAKGKPTLQSGAMNKPQFEQIIKEVVLK